MRWNDPKTAPLVPVEYEIKYNRDRYMPETGLGEAIERYAHVTIRLCGWKRDTDEIVEHEFRVVNPEGEIRVRPPSPDDREWLEKIGARTPETVFTASVERDYVGGGVVGWLEWTLDELDAKLRADDSEGDFMYGEGLRVSVQVNVHVAVDEP